jgi:hypothetical protein
MRNEERGMGRKLGMRSEEPVLLFSLFILHSSFLLCAFAPLREIFFEDVYGNEE